MANKKECVIKFVRAGSINFDCWEDRCAFWDEENKQCCIKTNMITLEKIKEKLEELKLYV